MLTKAIDTIIDIYSFEHHCVILKMLLPPERLKHHMVIIGVDQSLINSALYEHKCLENTRNYKRWPENVMINSSTRQLLKPPWYPLLRDFMTKVQCNLGNLLLLKT